MKNLRMSVLIQAVGKGIWDMCQEIEKIDRIKTVKVVIGTFDAIAYADLTQQMTCNHS